MNDTGDGFQRKQAEPPKKGNGSTGTTARFAPIWLDDIEEDRDPIWLVDGIIPAGPSFGETPGPPKTLKSFFLSDLLMHIAIGKPYGDRSVLQGAVIYITSEGVRGVKRRLRAMRKHHGIEKKKVPFALIPVMPNLGSGTDDLVELIEAITVKMQGVKVPLRAIAIDTMRKATPGKDENSAKDMSTFLQNCEALAAAFNCHVNAVHHSPRSDNNRGSGTNAVEASCDVILPVTRSDVGKLPRATITIGEMKDGESGDSWTIEMRTNEIGSYVVIVEPPARRAETKPKKAVPLSDAAKIAQQALAEALADVGVSPPATEHIPHTVKSVVTAKQWRDYAYRRNISTGKKRAQEAAFERAVKKLVLMHRVGVWDDNIWLVPREGDDQ
jgi:AAA domain